MSLVYAHQIFSGSDLYRVATAQGTQGIWMLTFPDRENTMNLGNF